MGQNINYQLDQATAIEGRKIQMFHLREEFISFLNRYFPSLRYYVELFERVEGEWALKVLLDKSQIVQNEDKIDQLARINFWITSYVQRYNLKISSVANSFKVENDEFINMLISL